ncbi:dienelactone hydrolase family protein [Maritalea porphyrae]|uniref:Dienelactone hydrolase n=1 Tax=Maritalea porphyrae TaxID=880732 RepID=A0ABQ5UMB0_9HYPH|nr:dienelactone hydrolase family protein [Maritalea porphyrae]GLQ16171.1 dienelactone hydrolase [Maritalea porphyrae]
MTHIVLFHSILGCRAAEREIANTFEKAGHTTYLPDLFDGKTAENYDDGFALFRMFDRDQLVDRARDALKSVPENAVLSGISFGAGMVSSLWADRPKMRGALLFAGAAEWAKELPRDLPVQAHIAKPDPFDDEAYFNEWQTDAPTQNLSIFRYDKVGHFFLDRAISDFDKDATKLCLERSIAFLDRLDDKDDVK